MKISTLIIPVHWNYQRMYNVGETWNNFREHMSHNEIIQLAKNKQKYENVLIIFSTNNV